MTTRPGFIWSGSEWVSIGQEAVVAPVSYQTSAPSTPSTGDIWIDSNDDVPGIDTSQFLRWRKTMAGGETSVSGTDDNGLTLAYTANYEQVYLNGVLLVRGQDYTATNGTSITGLTALAANDVVEVYGVVARVVGDVYTQAQSDSKYSPITTTGSVLISSTTIPASTSTITVSNVFSSAYDNYRIVVNGGTHSTSAYLYFAFSGISSGYYSALPYQLWSNTTLSGQNRSNQANAFAGAMTTAGVSIAMDVFGPNLTVQKSGITFCSGLATNDAFYWGGFYNATTTAQTGFTLTTASGTLTGGTIKVYGYK